MGREREIEGNGAHAWGDDDPDATRYQFPVPSMLSLHLGRPWWDGGAHAGWRRFGVTGRLRLFSIAEGATTSLALAANTHWRADAYDGSAALEQTVPLAWRLQLLLRAGVGGGRRNFAIVMPFDLDTTAGHDNTIGAAHLDLYRYDVRFEPVVGLVWRERLTLSVQPYTVLKHGGPQQVTCGLCVSGVRLLEFQESSGFAVALTLVLPEAVR
jgi:hypothetical protein